MRMRPSGWLVVALLVAAVPSLGQTPDWYYTYHQQQISLDLDTYRIAVFETTPAATGKVRELLASAESGVPRKDGRPSGSMDGGWTLADLTGTPSGGDALAVVDLIEALATDPETTAFASPVFSVGESFLVVTPEIHVGFNEGVPLSTVEAELLAAGVGAILESDWLRPNIFRVAGGSRSGIAVLDAANALAQLPDVYFAEVNWLITGERLAEVRVEYPPPEAMSSPSFKDASPRRLKGAPASLCGPLGVPLPNDPWLFQSWGLEIYNDMDIDAYGAWEVCTGSPQVIAAVLDDGIQPDHPDMPNVLAGSDFTDECLSPPCLGEPQSDCDRHGTAVASILGMAINNGAGSAGVAPEVSILPVRIAQYWLWGSTCIGRLEISWLANGIDYSVEHGARLTSLSWNLFLQSSTTIEVAYSDAVDAGVVNFNSAGNGNEPAVLFPGNIRDVHSVSGIDFFGDLFYVDEEFASNWGVDVEFTGPGQQVFAADRTGPLGYEDGTGLYGADYTSVTGTSHACPHVSGAAALVLAENPDLGPEEVFFILRETAVDLGDPGRDVYFGFGLCNADMAVKMAPEVIKVADFERSDYSGLTAVIEP